MQRPTSGFACNEAPIAALIVGVAVGLGFGASSVFGLQGALALVTPAALVGFLVLLVVVLNFIDSARRRSDS